MEEFKFSFEKLEVWQNSRVFVKAVYLIINKLPYEEKFAICNQLRRASVSVSSNIAEGSSRFSPKDQIRFIEIAYGSLIETYCQLKLCIDLDYVSETEIEECKNIIFQISRQLSSLKKSIQSKL
jgi:four helix bundle protein